MNENSRLIRVDLDAPQSAESEARLAALDANRDNHPIDYSDIPPMPDAWLKEAALRSRPVAKRPVSIRLDEDIIEFFKREDVHYQSRINAVLRCYVDSAR